MAEHIPRERGGVLKTNKTKRTEKSPDMSGQIMINGETHIIIAWKKITPFGELLSLSIPLPRVEQTYPKEIAPKKSTFLEDGDVPF